MDEQSYCSIHDTHPNKKEPCWQCVNQYAISFYDPNEPSIIHGTLLIHKERLRQIDVEGWTTEHDDKRSNGELTLAGVCYALSSLVYGKLMSRLYPIIRDLWPWSLDQEWKPKSPVRDLERAGALIAAEIDRVLRLNNGATKYPDKNGLPYLSTRYMPSKHEENVNE